MRTLLLFASILLLTPLVVFAQVNTDTAFIPLTSIPGIESAGNADSLPDFLNSLYRLAIGAAAVLAVLQIVRAGIMYMGGDSVTEKKEAKNLIALSIGGLVLILSPVVVFSIINPNILSLKIGGLVELTTTTPRVYTPGQVIGAGGGNTCGDYVSVAHVADSASCSTLGAGYEPVTGSCPMCTPPAGRKCCGTKTITNAKFGWKQWYIVPKAGGGTESKLFQSTGTFSTSALCLSSVRGAGTTLPANAVYDGSEGKGTMCTCNTELRVQGANCTPW
jgi:hypothetical protein